MNRLVGRLNYLRPLVPVARNAHRANICRASSSSSNTDFKPSEELARERYEVRSSDGIEKKRARLLYQSRKRGMLENGVILASFAEKYLHKLDAAHLDEYDRLINLPTNDWDIFYWATKTKPTPPEFETAIMQMLREHLNSKVSNDDGSMKADSVLGKTRPDDIVLPATKKVYPLEVDLDRVSLTDYEEQLFDFRVKKLQSDKSMALMTPWRRRYFEKRIRRKISSPSTASSLNNNENLEVFTQKSGPHDVLNESLISCNQVDNIYERNIKHHDVMQHIFSGALTDDVLDYDDEAEAWADMLWHRNYGTHDHRIAPSRDMHCLQCQSNLQCCDSGLEGYLPKELFTPLMFDRDREDQSGLICQKCKFSNIYDARLGQDISPEAYEHFLRKIHRDLSISVIVVLCDLTDFPGSLWKGLIDLIGGAKRRIIVVGNKLDLLPDNGPKLLPRVLYSMRKNLDRLRPGGRNKFVHDVIAISARTGFGVDGLVDRLLSYCETPQNICLVGNSHTGKSTLFNALLQSDLCAVRKGDIISRVTKYKCPITRTNLLKFPINSPEGWEVELMKRRIEAKERNFAERDLALKELTKRRQETMPHMSMLVNRLEFPSESQTSDLMVAHENHDDKAARDNLRPRFTDDHPLAAVDEGAPMSATEDKFSQLGYFYHTPSASHPDQIHSLLTYEEQMDVFHSQAIVPRKYSIRPLTSIFLSGLARLDLLTSQSNVIITVYASKYLPIHVVRTKNADKFYQSFLGTAYLGVPRGDEQRMTVWPDLVKGDEDFHIRGTTQYLGAADVVFSSIGWATISTIQDQECIVRAHTPQGRGIFLRSPPLLANTQKTGKKLRDTPMFNHPEFRIETMEADKIS